MVLGFLAAAVSIILINANTLIKPYTQPELISALVIDEPSNSSTPQPTSIPEVLGATIKPIPIVTASPSATPSPTQTPSTTPKPTTKPTQKASSSPTITPKSSESPSPTSTPKPKTAATEKPSPRPTTKEITGPEMDALFTKYADQYKVDRELLRRIAICESKLNINALNKAHGYGGLYQFSPGSWKSYRKLLGQDTDPELRFNPEEAIETAAWMLSTGRQSAWPNCK